MTVVIIAIYPTLIAFLLAYLLIRNNLCHFGILNTIFLIAFWHKGVTTFACQSRVKV